MVDYHRKLNVLAPAVIVAFTGLAGALPAQGQTAADSDPQPTITIKEVPADQATRPTPDGSGEAQQPASAGTPDKDEGDQDSPNVPRPDPDESASAPNLSASDDDSAASASATATSAPDGAQSASADADTDADTEAGAEKEIDDPSRAIQIRDLPDVVRNLEQHDVEIVGEFETPGGLRAFAGITQQQPIAIYLTPDEQHIIIGTMLDRNGHDMTQQPLTDASVGPWTTLTWDALSNSTWVADGQDDADHVVYMFTDPNCPFCHKFWLQARPWVDSGRVQIRHILVGVLTHTSPGKAAAILSAENPAQALHEHESAGPDDGVDPLDPISDDVARQLEQNAMLMEDLQIQGTPGIFYFDQQGALQVQRGAPLDADLDQILGPLD